MYEAASLFGIQGRMQAALKRMCWRKKEGYLLRLVSRDDFSPGFRFVTCSSCPPNVAADVDPRLYAQRAAALAGTVPSGTDLDMELVVWEVENEY